MACREKWESGIDLWFNIFNKVNKRKRERRCFCYIYYLLHELIIYIIYSPRVSLEKTCWKCCTCWKFSYLQSEGNYWRQWSWATQKYKTFKNCPFHRGIWHAWDCCAHHFLLEFEEEAGHFCKKNAHALTDKKAKMTSTFRGKPPNFRVRGFLV